MLFKIIHLKGIKEGEITLAFRKWKKPQIKKGSIIKSAVGQIEILDITTINQKDIKSEDAIKAGFDNIKDLISLLNNKKEGVVYRIKVAYHSADPRVELRNTTEFSEEDFLKIKLKLERLDKLSKNGNWTYDVLKSINDYPELRAKDLAKKLNFEKDWLKINIRKLKNMGLTISHQVGYSISPRGKSVLKKLLQDK